MSPLKKICVFCGASPGHSEEYTKAARLLGKEIVARKARLVYGGGSVGLMGEVARTVMAEAGVSAVYGVIPESMISREVGGEMIGDTIVVADMHERKAKMAAAADSFIALPGGYGTMEELMEMLTWHQLGYHRKPIGVLNVNGFFDPLLTYFDHANKEGFIRKDCRDILLVSKDASDLISKMEAYVPGASLIDELKAENTST